MKRALGALIILLGVGNMALASATNWFIYAQVGALDDRYQGVYNTMGVKPLAEDGLDAYDPPYWIDDGSDNEDSCTANPWD